MEGAIALTDQKLQIREKERNQRIGSFRRGNWVSYKAGKEAEEENPPDIIEGVETPGNDYSINTEKHNENNFAPRKGT